MTETSAQRWRRQHREQVRDINARSARKQRATQLAWNEANPERVAYAKQKHMAKKRGIEFLLSLEEWVAWWGSDFALRGRKSGDLVMARIGDTGPYSLDNIEKITAKVNNEDRGPSLSQSEES